MIVRAWTDLDRWLAGAPDRMITVALLGLAALAVAVALFGPRPLKAAVLAWMVAP